MTVLLFSARQNDTASTPNDFRMEQYNLIVRNCEHFAVSCSTDQTMIQRCSSENSGPGILK